jgi:hypothetical protein
MCNVEDYHLIKLITQFLPFLVLRDTKTFKKRKKRSMKEKLEADTVYTSRSVSILLSDVVGNYSNF